MKHPIIVGDYEFATKIAALNHFKNILNSYSPGMELNEGDLSDVLALVAIHPKALEKIGVGIITILVSKVQYNTKCFELIRCDSSTEYISYTKMINSPKSQFTIFSEACRKAIRDDLRAVKLDYFRKFSKHGKVKCQETGLLAKYEELTVDHRQPLTFSMIVDRFIEVNKIDLKQVKYLRISGAPNELADDELKNSFINYHKEKANLRIVCKHLNLGRSNQARIHKQKKDL